MKKLTLTIFALAISLSAACVSNQEPDTDWNLEECTDGCEEEQGQPQLNATFVSGHLGNYMDCPGDGYTAGGFAGGAPRNGDAACADGEDCDYNDALNCEDGQLTVRLSNEGDAAAEGLQVTTIELFDVDGTSKATLPLIDAINTSSNQAFDGTLEAGEKVTLRVEFLGPENPYSLLVVDDDYDEPSGGDRMSGGSGSGTIEMTITSDNHADVTVESTELYPVPSIAT